MKNISTSFLKRQTMNLLSDEIFLVQVEEILKKGGDLEEAAAVREAIDRLRAQRLKAKEWIS